MFLLFLERLQAACSLDYRRRALANVHVVLCFVGLLELTGLLEMDASGCPGCFVFCVRNLDFVTRALGYVMLIAWAILLESLETDGH